MQSSVYSKYYGPLGSLTTESGQGALTRKETDSMEITLIKGSDSINVCPKRLMRAVKMIQAKEVAVEVVTRPYLGLVMARAFVDSFKEEKTYAVSFGHDEATCSCPDWMYRKDEINGVCKHILVVALYCETHPEDRGPVEKPAN
jgi:hypothetical protein